MEVKLTDDQGIHALILATKQLKAQRQLLAEVQGIPLSNLVVPALKREIDELVKLREDITAQLEFDEEVEM